MPNIKFRCIVCDNEFTFEDAFESLNPCSVYYNNPLKGLNILDMACPNCGERVREKVEQEVIYK
jgi:uncharacterized protein YlaI